MHPIAKGGKLARRVRGPRPAGRFHSLVLGLYSQRQGRRHCRLSWRLRRDALDPWSCMHACTSLVFFPLSRKTECMRPLSLCYNALLFVTRTYMVQRHLKNGKALHHQATHPEPSYYEETTLKFGTFISLSSHVTRSSAACQKQI